MNTLLNDRDEDLEDRDLRHRQYNNGRDREITLGTTMILGIFFALAVLCAAFFGFGYSTGRHSALAAPPAAGTAAASSNGILKPGAGTTANNPYNPQPLPGDPAPAFGIPVPHLLAEATLPKPTPAPVRVVSPNPGIGPYVPPAPVNSPVRPQALPVAATVSAPTPATASPLAPGSFMVQIAAVSHQEDGELLVTSLKRRGYNVAIHTEPQDKLLHVQIGPFNNRREADSMRQRLLGDGFNAIVK